MIRLNCPACGAMLELPQGLEVARCAYCGSSIMLHEPQPNAEQVTVQRFVDLCKVAVKAKNYPEVIQYCNRILEVDPGNVEAWIDKGVATACLSTKWCDRSNEAVQYLRQATEADPDGARLSLVIEPLVVLFQEKWVSDYLGPRQVFDGSYTIFEYGLRLWQGRWEAEVNLPRLKTRLEKAEATLAGLRAEDRLHFGQSIQEAERQVNSLRSLIAEGEKAANWAARANREP